MMCFIATAASAQDCPDPDKDKAIGFAKDISPFLTRSCVDAKCHDSQRKKDGIDMETYEGAKKGYRRSLRSIKRRKMPIRRFPKITPEELALFQQWAKEGFKP